MTVGRTTDASPVPPPDDFPSDPLARLDRMRWSSLATVLSVIALPQLTVALVAAVTAPWFVARNGVLINGEPHLYAPVTELLPGWLLWTAAAAACALVAYTWAVAVRYLVLVQAQDGHPLPAALREGAASVPAVLVVFAAAAGVYLGIGAVLARVLDDPHPAWAVGVWLVLFLVLPPLWFPLAGVALGPGAWREVVAVLRGGPHRRRPTPVLFWAVAALAAFPLGVHLMEGPETLPFMWPLGVVALTASAILITAVSMEHRETVLGVGEADRDGPASGDHADGEGPIPGGRAIAGSEEKERRQYTGLALTAVLLLGLAAPAQLHSAIAERDPWSAPAYDRWSGAPAGRDGNEVPILFAPDGSVFLGGERALCEPPEACDTEQDPDDTGSSGPAPPDRDDGLAMTATDVQTVRTVDFPSQDAEAPPGSVVVQNQCLTNRACDEEDEEEPVILEPDGEVHGEWNAADTDETEERTTQDWRDQARIWAEHLDARDHIVTYVPSVDRSESMLTLFVCRDDDCGSQSAVELARFDGQPMWQEYNPGPVRPKLVDFALSSDDAARVTVHDPDSGRLTLHACSDERCSEVTTTELVAGSTATRAADPARSAHAGAQIEVRHDGTPIVMHRATRDGSVELLDCADAHCSEYEAREVFGPGANRPAPAMDLGQDGLPVLLGHDLAAEEVTLVACADEACAENERTTVDAFEGNPGWVALRVDGQGRPVMAWAGSDQGRGTVEFLRCGDTSCSPLHPKEHR